MKESSTKAQWLSLIDQMDEVKWQGATGKTHYPCAQCEFDNALEDSKSVGDDNGWYPEHLLVMNDDSPLAIAPTYLKTYYQEEFFDWARADVYPAPQ